MTGDFFLVAAIALAAAAILLTWHFRTMRRVPSYPVTMPVPVVYRGRHEKTAPRRIPEWPFTSGHPVR